MTALHLAERAHERGQEWPNSMREAAMSDMQTGEMLTNTDRLNNFSDGVVAVIITLMVLELKAPSVSSFAALVPLWPEAVSYAVSYLFIAIIWVNHHHLMRFVSDATPRLI